MKESDWKETELEYEFDAAGNKVPKKVKYVQAYFTPRKKERIDFYLRFIGSLSILVPLLLLYFQRNNELKKENRLALTSVYTSFAKDVSVWNDVWKDSSTATYRIDTLYNSYIPKLTVYGDDKLTKEFTSLYQSAYVRNQIHQINLYLYTLTDSVNAFYTMMDLPETDTTYQIYNDDFVDDSAALFSVLNRLYSMEIHLSELKANITVFLWSEDKQTSANKLRQDSVLQALDDFAKSLSSLSLVPITSTIQYQKIKSMRVDTFAFVIPQISIPYRNKMFAAYSNIVNQSRKNDEAYTKEVKQFQKDLLAYIK